MNPPRATDLQYIDFLIGTPKVASACEAARVQPPDPKAPAHDAFSRLLARLEPDPETLWQEVRPLVRRADCIGGVDEAVIGGVDRIAVAPREGDEVDAADDAKGLAGFVRKPFVTQELYGLIHSVLG